MQEPLHLIASMAPNKICHDQYDEIFEIHMFYFLSEILKCYALQGLSITNSPLCDGPEGYYSHQAMQNLVWVMILRIIMFLKK